MALVCVLSPSNAPENTFLTFSLVNENTGLDPESLASYNVEWYLHSSIPLSHLTHPVLHRIYNWETWRPAKTTYAGTSPSNFEPISQTLPLSNLNWIGTQRCIDCDSSPIAQLQTRAAEQGWNTLLTLNEPDISGTLPSDAAAWYIQYINPIYLSQFSCRSF
jgi:hypothetical protein